MKSRTELLRRGSSLWDTRRYCHSRIHLHALEFYETSYEGYGWGLGLRVPGVVGRLVGLRLCALRVSQAPRFSPGALRVTSEPGNTLQSWCLFSPIGGTKTSADTVLIYVTMARHNHHILMVAQGGGMALASAVELEWRVGGVVALSPIVPPRLVRHHASKEADLLTRMRLAIAGLRVLACHGAQDRVAPLAFAGPIYDWLGGLGAAVHVENWDEMAHELSLNELCRAREFLLEQIPSQPVVRSGGGPREQVSFGAPLSSNAVGILLSSSVGTVEAGPGDVSEPAWNASKTSLSRFITHWSDPAAKVWVANLQRTKGMT
jgi:hypothetical protein